MFFAIHRRSNHALDVLWQGPIVFCFLSIVLRPVIRGKEETQSIDDGCDNEQRQTHHWNDVSAVWGEIFVHREHIIQNTWREHTRDSQIHITGERSQVISHIYAIIIEILFLFGLCHFQSNRSFPCRGGPFDVWISPTRTTTINNRSNRLKSCFTMDFFNFSIIHGI